MRTHLKSDPKRRRGAVAVLVAFLMVPLIGMVAMAVDYGYLCAVQTDLQRAADAAALAGVRDIIPNEYGYQDQAKVRNRVREYAAANLPSMSGFTVADSDIEIGRYNPATIYTKVELLNDGILDTVRVKLRRDTTLNSPVSLFFARIFGIQTANVTVTATAILQKASFIPPGGDILPFALQDTSWDQIGQYKSFVIYDDTKMTDLVGNPIPGNWGTLDIGYTNNSVSDMNDQIMTGLRQADLDALYADDRIASAVSFNTTEAGWFQADTGLSQGLKQSITQVYGSYKLIPIYDTLTGVAGQNLEYHVVKWGLVKVINSTWGSDPTVTLQKFVIYDGRLAAQKDLGNTSGTIDGVYTTPVLVR
jgi:Flp pilus assembly protein TadG